MNSCLVLHLRCYGRRYDLSLEGAVMTANHEHHVQAEHRSAEERLAPAQSLNRVAFSATVHCLTGCAIGEVLGMIIGTALGWSNLATIVLAVLLAFVFGYSLTMIPLRRAQLPWRTAIYLAFVSDTASIALMEIVDNAIMLMIPGAMDAGLSAPLFWGSLIASLIIAGAAAFPLNRWLITRGWGHAVVQAYHHDHSRFPLGKIC